MSGSCTIPGLNQRTTHYSYVQRSFRTRISPEIQHFLLSDTPRDVDTSLLKGCGREEVEYETSSPIHVTFLLSPSFRKPYMTQLVRRNKVPKCLRNYMSISNVYTVPRYRTFQRLYKPGSYIVHTHTECYRSRIRTYNNDNKRIHICYILYIITINVLNTRYFTC